MRVRWVLVALASGGLALGLTAPGAVTAAPESLKPSGEALVRIDGGSARAIEQAPMEYRVVVPNGASIRWLGEANRKLTIGTLGRKGLVASWTRLGHSSRGKGAMATITWQGSGDDRPTFVGAYVTKPKLTSEGTVTFVARTASPLPATLPRFTLNIARPVPTVSGTAVRSGYPLVFPVNASSSTVGVQGTATSDTTATVVFGTTTNGAITAPCAKPAPVNLSPTSDYVNFAGTCGDTTWTGGTLGLSIMQAGFATSSSQIYMLADVFVKGGTPSSFSWNFTMGEWKAGGVKVWP